MAKRTSSSSKPPRVDVRQMVTDKFLAMMEDTNGNFVLPWVAAGRSLETPINIVSGKAYRGSNTMVLMAAAMEAGYTSPKWASWKQWFELGGGVLEGGKIVKDSTYNLKGQEGTPVVYVKKFPKREDKPDDKGGFMLKYSTVFNADQVDGYEDVPRELPDLVTRIEAADQFFRHLLAKVEEGHDAADYSPYLDLIRLPNPEQFKNTEFGTALEHYYTVKGHEYIHWTGHESRCNRDLSGKYGSEKYAREEAVAVWGSIFLLAHLGITLAPPKEWAFYMKGWLSVVKQDKTALFEAAAKAQKAVDFMIAKQPAAQIEDGEEVQDFEDDELLAA